ncbi:MAG: lipoate--protein ligase [Bacteroidales bacterium]
MIFILNHSTDPAYNLAAEEYVLKNFTDDVFMLWRNANAIIVGKHQNTMAEINMPFVQEKGIRVIRRLSGGGAVFHDLGNLNFTFIMNGQGEKLIDFRKYTQPILEVMQKLDIPAQFEGRNDLTIDGRKFSGNAEHVHKSRVLHHGTLLFSSEIADLTGALNAKNDRYSDKGVKSVRSRVTNISEHLKEPMTVLEFAGMIMDHVRETYADAEMYDFSPRDVEAISKLKVDKYDTWDWNFGYSPQYDFHQVVKTSGGTIELALQVEKGVIRDARFSGDFFNKRDVHELERMFPGCMHEPESVGAMLDTVQIGEYFLGATREEVISLFF